MLRSLLEEDDVNDILSIRPSITNGHDILHWTYSSNGVYSVKTGYHSQRILNSNQNQISQVPASPTLVFKNKIPAKIWRTNIPPKLYFFWWKILNNRLLVAENIRKRGIQIPKDCQVCGEETETLSHMIFECRVDKEIWSVAGVNIASGKNQEHTILRTMLDFFYIGQSEPHNNWPCFLGRRIWKMRNKLLFENKRDHIINVINAASLEYNLE